MFCQHYASSLPLGDCGPDSKRFTDLTIDTAAIFAQTRTRLIDSWGRVPEDLKSDRFRDPNNQR